MLLCVASWARLVLSWPRPRTPAGPKKDVSGEVELERMEAGKPWQVVAVAGSVSK